MNKFQKLKYKHIKNLKLIDKYEGVKHTRQVKLYNNYLAATLAHIDLIIIQYKKEKAKNE